MKPSNNCLTLIKKYEGLYLNAYTDFSAVSIGYGTTKYPNNKSVKLGDKITKEQAEEYLLFECETISDSLDPLIIIDVNQNQFDALVSFTYNFGVGAFERSTLRKKLNKGDILGASQEFERWVFVTESGVKKKLLGLVKRRKEEQELFLKEVD